MKYILILSLLTSFVYANWKTDRENLEHCYIDPPFRIFYSLNGKNKLTHYIDQNQNNVADYVDNIADQLRIANDLLAKKIHLIEPLQNKNYKNKAKYIDIHILSLKHNGLAGDAIIKYNYKAIDNNSYSISMSLSNKLSYTNLTPLHELIHIYQNGYTKIKNRWVTEGIARLLEELIRNKKTRSSKLPSNSVKLNIMLSQKYKNASYFKRFDELCKKDNFIKIFLEELSSQDKKIEDKYNYKKMDWLEKDQKSSKNNPFIFKAIQNSIIKTCPSDNKEIQTFYKLINEKSY
jgi:hypothetical protein